MPEEADASVVLICFTQHARFRTETFLKNDAENLVHMAEFPQFLRLGVSPKYIYVCRLAFISGSYGTTAIEKKGCLTHDAVQLG